MKKPFRFLISIVMLGVLLIAGHIFYLSTLSATETYPEDDYLLGAQSKKALIIVAHDDDMAGSAGTMKMLTENGWCIREMCFYQQGGRYFKKDSAKNPLRKEALRKVAEIQGFQAVDPVDFNFRFDMETEKSYMPMPYEQFASHYNIDSLLTIIGGYIEKHKPSVIFTLDNVMGGYGHPDHTLMSQLVMRYCREHKFDTSFSVKKIYQAVFPPSLAERVMKNMPVYKEAKKMYGVNHPPQPNVQINFYDYASEKKECLETYSTEQNSLRKIWPYYHWYPSWIYFRIFNRDFYRVLSVADL